MCTSGIEAELLRQTLKLNTKKGLWDLLKYKIKMYFTFFEKFKNCCLTFRSFSFKLVESSKKKL